MAGSDGEDPLAYGDYHEKGPSNDDEAYDGAERGIIGDSFRRLRGRYQSHQPQDQYYQGVSYACEECHQMEKSIDEVRFSPNTRIRM